jgi:hypothetical protein
MFNRVVTNDSLWASLFPGKSQLAISKCMMEHGVESARALLLGEDRSNIAVTPQHPQLPHNTPPQIPPAPTISQGSSLPPMQYDSEDEGSEIDHEVPLPPVAGTSMGTSIDYRRSTYLGLSSGTTFLRAILQIIDDTGALRDLLHAPRSAPNAAIHTPTHSIRTATFPLPSMFEIRPYVDGYFAYFRWFAFSRLPT